jgi:hypothetical protein
MRNLSENWPEMPMPRHRILCECVRCRQRRISDNYIERLADQSLSTALRHAQDWAEMEADEAGLDRTKRAGPPKGLILRQSIRWSKPASVAEILDEHAETLLKDDFFKPLSNKRLRLYCVTRGGKVLYIGLIYGTGQSVGNRIRQHAGRGKEIRDRAPWPRGSESKQLAAMLKQKKTQDATNVQFADITVPKGYTPDPKYAHAIELLLQNSLRSQTEDKQPQIYFSGNLTFEGEDDVE